MEKIRLPVFKARDCGKRNSEIFALSAKAFYWLGSVVASDRNAKAFFEAAQAGELEALLESQAMGGDNLVALLAEFECDNFEVILFESPEEPTKDERIISRIKVKRNLLIEGEPLDEKTENRIWQETSFGLREILKAIFAKRF